MRGRKHLDAVLITAGVLAVAGLACLWVSMMFDSVYQLMARGQSAAIGRLVYLFALWVLGGTAVSLLAAWRVHTAEARAAARHAQLAAPPEAAATGAPAGQSAPERKPAVGPAREGPVTGPATAHS